MRFIPPFYEHPQLLSALSLSLLISANVVDATPVQPDAGQISQEFKKQPVLTQPSSVELLKTEEDAVEASSGASALKIKVNAINISGNKLFSNNELAALVDDLIGSEHNFVEINNSVAKISRFYRTRGYAVARAYLPAQELKDGVITIKILEGIVGAQTLDNQSRLSDTRVNSMLADIKVGQPLQVTPVDRAVLLLSDTPGVGGARATLQPGASVGTSDLLIDLDPAKAYFANAEFDNFGSHYTGEYRTGAAVAINSPLNIGDQLTIRGLTSNDNLTYARMAYQIPVGGSGFKLGGAYSDTRYKFMIDTSKFYGSASSASIYTTYPFIRSQNTNLYGTMTLEQKNLSDVQIATTTDKKVRLGNLGLAGNHQDGLFGGGISAFDSSLVSGKLSLDADTLRIDSGADSANSNGRFSKLNLNFNRLQRITDSNTLSIVLSGQRASKNLNSSEKFYLGGANAVRAYPQGEAGGDQGWMVNAELRRSFMNNLQGVAFYDAGAVNINHNAYLPGSNTRSISGAGLGLNAQYKILQIKTAVAWPLHGGQASAEPVTMNRKPRLWVQMSGVF
jgi:hemolysin activation/secretion protein